MHTFVKWANRSWEYAYELLICEAFKDIKHFYYSYCSSAIDKVIQWFILSFLLREFKLYDVWFNVAEWLTPSVTTVWVPQETMILSDKVAVWRLVVVPDAQKCINNACRGTWGLPPSLKLRTSIWKSDLPRGP